MQSRTGKRGFLEDAGLVFAGKLCLALGHGSIAETFALSAAEFAFWGQFYRRFGFPADRAEWSAAIAGAAVCRSLGNGKVEAKHLIPQFGGRSARSVAAAFSGIPGAKVERREKPRG